MPNPSGLLVLALIGQVDLPGTSSVSVPMADSNSCNCHFAFDEEESAGSTWLGSPMGHAARNPLFLSALTEAEKDVPGVGDFCLRCHAPAAWLEGRCFPTDGTGLLSNDGGVECAACHRMDPSPWQRNGQYLIGEDLVYRGPIENPAAPHAVQSSAFVSRSEMCGACHDLHNPLVDRVDLDGTPMNMPFPEQTTYTEWATSSVAKSCQDCHMDGIPGPVAMNGPVRQERSRHAFAGGNAFVLAAIDFLEPGLGISNELQQGVRRMLEMLRTAARLEVVDVQAARRGEPVSFTVRVTNLTGHKLPTGYPEGRRVWMEVRSPRLALWLGRFADGEIEDPPALYRTVHGQNATGPGHRLALNDTVFEDTRIPPAGMVVTATTAPVGKVYPEVEPGVLAHWDDVTVTAMVPCDTTDAAIEVQVRLWYQSVTRAYVEALADENGADPRGFRLLSAFDEADPGPAEMVTLRVVLPVDATSACDVPDADAGTIQDAGRTDTGSSTDAGVTVDPDDGDGCGCSTAAADGPAPIGLLVLIGFFWRRRSSG